ncbi:cytochrome-c oxidase, cbb3-type subunit III [Sneathiella sp. P13V-1]|uniref:cytochrome-c oxidase, cbb3-type subunit III n=1 Tax=Sneathiella sp. P13V-1 TaxID=2697366 RepID=UPI00187B4B24|nr:cytochrome-c oxidase, cbb3-type subunit III [Sneathiella sp. P13V-1]MBE7636666.1 cytochrome-c oxidase, cbb3-type subunit III [Sneathiella sp. P13V-1]
MSKVERDEHSGTETTGHEWDGIKELDTPMPRWWLWSFYACIVWSIGYWIVMPAWPLVSDYTRGMLGYSSRALVTEELATVAAGRAEVTKALQETELADVKNNQELYQFAVSGGRSHYAVNCSQCHGSGAQGGPGFPNLNDDDWLWGGKVDEIYATIQYGIRSDHDETRTGEMPAFLKDEILEKGQVNDVTEYVLSLSQEGRDAEAVARGKEVFMNECASCHGENAKGGREFGAPNLTDAIWFYGGDKETVQKTIANGRQNVMPAWADRLDDTVIRQIALYVHSLGGGE